MSKIKNGGLDQYGAEPFEQQQFGTPGVEGVNINSLTLTLILTQFPFRIYIPHFTLTRLGIISPYMSIRRLALTAKHTGQESGDDLCEIFKF